MRCFLLALAASIALGCEGERPPPEGVAPKLIAPEADVVRALGSGAMTPLTRKLVQAYRGPGGAPRIVVEPSVGSGGGVRAASEGAVDLGLVARPLKDAEVGFGLTVVPVARDLVIVAAHRDVSVDDVSRDLLVELSAGRKAAFSDGSPAVFLLRDRDESANDAIERMVPTLRTAREAAYASRVLRVLYHDDAMGEALAATPGAIGLFSLGSVTVASLPVKVLSIDGVRPSAAAVAEGKWTATRQLAFVVRPDRLPRVRAFLDFVSSDEGRRIVRESGYLPP